MTDQHSAKAREIITTLGATDHSATIAYLATVLDAAYWRGFTAAREEAKEERCGRVVA